MILPAVAFNLERSNALVDEKQLTAILSGYEYGKDYCFTQYNTPLSTFSKWKIQCVIVRRQLADARALGKEIELALQCFQPKQIEASLMWDYPHVSYDLS